MKTTLAVIGIVAILIGTAFGLLNWYLVEFYLETVEWEGPVVEFNKLTWLLNILGIGAGGVMIGVAAMLPSAPAAGRGNPYAQDSFGAGSNPYGPG